MACHAGADDHRFLEVIVLAGRVFVDVLELVLTDGHDVTIFKRVLFDQLAVDVSAVGTVEILEKRVIQYRDDRAVLATDREIVDLNVVFGFPTDDDSFLPE